MQELRAEVATLRAQVVALRVERVDGQREKSVQQLVMSTQITMTNNGQTIQAKNRDQEATNALTRTTQAAQPNPVIRPDQEGNLTQWSVLIRQKDFIFLQ